MSNPQICLVIDTPKSGSAEIIADLVENCEYKDSVTLAVGEEFNEEHLTKAALFFRTKLDEDLLDQIEAFKRFIEANELTVDRVLACINTELVYKHEQLLPWFEAAIHFADYVLLTNVKDLPHDFAAKYSKTFTDEKCFPCFFEIIKTGKVKNPRLVMDSEPRRMTHIFDDIDVFDELDIDEDNLPEEPFTIDKNTDPYLKRDEDGNRLIKLPLITEQ